jgi:hypothetical protein
MTDYIPNPASRLLRILVIADSKITVPPHGYGGAERIFAHLCEGFARRGHAVTLMAAEGSTNYGRLVTYPWAGQSATAWRGYCKFNFAVRSLRELLAGHDVVLAGCRTDYLIPFLLAGTPLIYRFGNPIDRSDVDRLQNAAKGPLSLVSVIALLFQIARRHKLAVSLRVHHDPAGLPFHTINAADRHPSRTSQSHSSIRTNTKMLY